MTKVIVFGGSGFIGRYIVKELAASGYLIKIFSRKKTEAEALKVCGDVGQIVPVSANVLDERAIEKHIAGMDVVINLVGLLAEEGTQKFDSVHNIAAKNIAYHAHQVEAKQLIHFSALGVENTSRYNDTKRNGESSVLANFPEAVIIRPSVVFGHEDSFFNMFGKISCLSPVLPLIGGGNVIMQPVYVGDVAQFVKYIVDNKIGKRVFSLVGPKKYSFKELIKFILATTNRKRILLNVNFSVAKAISYFLEMKLVSMFLKPITGTSKSVLTRDQVELLKYDNISDSNDLEVAGIEPKTIEEIVPQYLDKYRKH